MKLAIFLLLSSFSLADSISTPTGGFVWVTPPAYTVGNVEGEYSATMPEIYSLQFGQDLTSQFYYKIGDTEYTGTFSSWSFQGSLFYGSFTGTKISFYHGTWSYYALDAIAGTLTQQLTLLPNCQGYQCGTMAFGSLALNESTVPEPAAWIMALTGLCLVWSGRLFKGPPFLLRLSSRSKEIA